MDRDELNDEQAQGDEDHDAPLEVVVHKLARGDVEDDVQDGKDDANLCQAYWLH